VQRTRDNSGTVEVDGEVYDWEIRRQPQPKADGTWNGIAITLKLQGFQREAIVQFPMPMHPSGRPEMEKQRIDLDAVINAVTSVIEAGWNPTSRGRPMVFDVDAQGH
jgi:hypothetical protein